MYLLCKAESEEEILLGILAGRPGSFNIRAEKCRRGKWKSFCSTCSKGEGVELRDGHLVITSPRGGKRAKDARKWEKAESSWRGDNRKCCQKYNVCVCVRHIPPGSDAEIPRDPQITQRSKVSQAWAFDEMSLSSMPSLLQLLFHFPLFSSGPSH